MGRWQRQGRYSHERKQRLADLAGEGRVSRRSERDWKKYAKQKGINPNNRPFENPVDKFIRRLTGNWGR